MRVLVCGGRKFRDRALLWSTLLGLDNIEVIIHGDAPGADWLAHKFAIKQGVKPLPYPADWKRYGPAAGPIRNKQMLAEGKPDLVVAFPGGSGTANLVRLARVAGIEVREVTWRCNILHYAG